MCIIDKHHKVLLQAEPTTSCHAGQHWYNRTQCKYTTKHNRFSMDI